MADLISTDLALSETEWSLLRALLDTLVPASQDGAMPSAADLGFDTYLVAQAGAYVAELRQVLAQFEGSFADLPMSGRCERVSAFSAANPGLFVNLLSRVYDCYYQDDRVRTQIGVVKGAPFPQGNALEPGDLSLLDPVVAGAERHRYRRP